MYANLKADWTPWNPNPMSLAPPFSLNVILS